MSGFSGAVVVSFALCASTAFALSKLELKSAAEGMYTIPGFVPTQHEMVIQHVFEQRQLLQHDTHTGGDQVPAQMPSSVVPQAVLPAAPTASGVPAMPAVASASSPIPGIPVVASASSPIPGIPVVASATSGAPQGVPVVAGVPSYPASQPMVQGVSQAAAIPSYPRPQQVTTGSVPAFSPVVPSADRQPPPVPPVTSVAASGSGSLFRSNSGNSYEPVKFMPKQSVTMCCCAKCGSTALYDFIYSAEFGKVWPYQGTAPYIQEILSDRWAGKWAVADQTMTSPLLKKSKFSIALVRDPIERLVSAWRSKISCPREFNGKSISEGDSPEEKDRKTKGLLELQGKGRTEKCLEFEDFLAVLRDIQLQNKTLKLDDHFMPQSQYCFQHSKPDEWTQVVSIGEPGSLSQLAAALGTKENADTNEAPAKTHGTGFHKPLMLAAQPFKLLHDITADDYAMFGKFLPKEASKTNPPPQLKGKPAPILAMAKPKPKTKEGAAMTAKHAPKAVAGKPAPKADKAAAPTPAMK